MSMEFQKKVQRLGIGGIQLSRPKDLIDEAKIAVARNMRIYQVGELRVRPGYGSSALFTDDAPAAIHTLRRFNDTLAGTYAWLMGAGSVLYYGVEGAGLTSKATGLSGKPLSMAFIRPSQAAKAWAYVADSSAMYKVGTDGTTRNWSILGLNVPVSAVVAQAPHKEIDSFNSAAGWTQGGTAGALSSPGDRVNFAIPTGGIIYDSGTTGWANIIPGTLDSNFQPGVMLTYNSGGGTEERARINSVSQASGTTTIASIRYDSGTSGMATVLLTTPTNNLEKDSTIAITTGVTTYNVRVIEVIPSATHAPSIRINAPTTHLVGDAVVGVRSYRTYLVSNHAAAEDVETAYCRFTNSAGVGTQVLSGLSLDLTKSNTLGERPFVSHDTIHISVRITNPAALTELQIKLDCDSATNDGTKNYFYYALQPSAFASVTAGTSTTLTATQVDVQREAIIGYKKPDYVSDPAQYNYYGSGGDYSYNDPSYVSSYQTGIYTEPVYGTVSVASTSAGVSDTASGASQWTELQIKLSDFKRIGTDYSRGWGDIKALIIQAETTASVDIDLDSWYIWGSLNPGSDVSNIALPYNYLVVCRNRNTGDRSLGSPALRTGLTLTQNAVNLSWSESSDAQVTDYDVYRHGGTLTEWIYLGTSPATGTGTVTFYDNFGDQDIAANPVLSREDYPVFPMLDLSRSGTATIKGNILEKTGGDNFNTLWAAGVRIMVKDSTGQSYICGLYARPGSSTVLELDSSPGYTGTVSWVISEPVLLSQPLAAVWGPYGGGIDNPYIFACGSGLQAGTLFWTNGGRPGSASLRNQLEITSPQEPLIGGAIYDGQAFCWSRKRMFRIFPSGEGQFQAQEVANSKGLSSRTCVAVGQLMFFVGDDGIYATTGGQPYSITDKDLYPLFPHEGQPEESINGISPPDFSQRDKFNLEYKNDYLYFTFIAADGNYYTLVFDVSRLSTGLSANPEDAGGWVSLDNYTPQATLFCNEDPDNDDRSRLVIGTATGKVYLPTATQDAGTAIPFTIETQHFGADSPEIYKRWSSINVECALDGQILNVEATENIAGPTTTLGSATVNERGTLEFSLLDGEGISSRYAGFILTGESSATYSPRFYNLIAYFTPQSMGSDLVWSAPSDLGDPGAKWFQGIEIEADTGGADKQYQVIYDEGSLGPTITVNHNGQVTKGYSFDPPFIAHTVRLKPLTSGEIKFIDSKWIFEPEPDLVKVWQPQPTTHDYPGWQHIRSGYLALRSTSVVTFTIIADGVRTTTYSIPSTGGELLKYYFPVFAKGRVFSYRLTSTSGFRVYQRDLELHTKPWGSGEGYAIIKPFGKASRTNGGATI